MTLTNIADGFCAIDIVHKKGAVSDFATIAEIKTAATKVRYACVQNGAPNTGGMIRNVGTFTKTGP